MPLATTLPTLIDFYNRMEDGMISRNIVEILAREDAIRLDIPWKASNLATGHLTTYRTSLPGVTKRRLNQGVAATKSTTMQRTETMAMLETRAEVDLKLAKLNGNTESWRMSEDAAFIESLNQTFVDLLFYGNQDSNEVEFTGLAPRYAATSNSDTGGQIIKAGGSSSDNSSMWLVAWGDNSVYGIYPKNSQAGIQYKDLGEIDCFDASNNKFRGLASIYGWDCGLAVQNYKNIVRIANIDMSDLATAGDSTDTSTNLIKHMTRAVNMINNPSGKQMVFYCNRTVMTYLEIKMKLFSDTFRYVDLVDPLYGVTYTEMRFKGIPIRRCDAILNTETAIS
jgi:hypothetical protein